jgi:hypothetical protein
MERVPEKRSPLLVCVRTWKSARSERATNFYCARSGGDLCAPGRDDHKLLPGITHRAIFRKCSQVVYGVKWKWGKSRCRKYFMYLRECVRPLVLLTVFSRARHECTHALIPKPIYIRLSRGGLKHLNADGVTW